MGPPPSFNNLLFVTYHIPSSEDTVGPDGAPSLRVHELVKLLEPASISLLRQGPLRSSLVSLTPNYLVSSFLRKNCPNSSLFKNQGSFEWGY